MSIWRAPLLILGILLILLAAGALAAPWLIDFNRYKPQIERWAEDVSGRAVRIGGDVEFVLFPWPAARMADVRVAGVRGGRFEHLLRVRQVRARFSLAALLGGRLEVEHVRLLQPRLMLEHLGDGRGNWMLRPRARARLPFSAERVAIDAVEVIDGAIELADQRLREPLRIDSVQARISAARLTGPWRLSGRWRLLERDWQVRISSGRIEAGRPVNLSLRMRPSDGAAGYLLQLDGALSMAGDGTGEKVAGGAAGEAGAGDEAGRAGQAGETAPRFRGRLSLRPVLPEGRGDPLDPARQVEIGSEVLLTPDVAELTKLKITPRIAASPFDVAQGRARLEFGPVLDVSIALGTTQLRVTPALQRLLGLAAAAGVQASARDGRADDGLALLRRHLLALAKRLLQLPPEMLLELDLQAAQLQVAGRVFSAVALSAEASSELLTVRHLRADMPGRGDISFRGNLLAGDLLQLTGELSARADDARGLLFGLVPDAQRLLEPLWRGRGGRLRLLATVDMTDHALRMVSRRLTLDDVPMRLDWRLFEPARTGAGREQVLRLAMRRLDLDGQSRGGSVVAALADVLWRLPRGAETGIGDDVQLELKAEKLRLGGQVWRGVELALRRRPGSMVLRRLAARGMAGVVLEGSGDFRRGKEGGWQGGLKARLRGEEAEAAWQVVRRLASPASPGLVAEEPPAWLLRSGVVDVNLLLRAGVGRGAEAGGDGGAGGAGAGAGSADAGTSAGEGAQWLEVALHGRAGGLRGNVSARLQDVGQERQAGAGGDGGAWSDAFWRTARWHLRGDVQAREGMRLLALPGLRGRVGEGAAASVQGEGSVKLALDGVPERQMRGELALTLPGLALRVNGTGRLAVEQDGAAADGGAAGQGAGEVGGWRWWPVPLQGEADVSLQVQDLARWSGLLDAALPATGVKGSARLAFSPRRWVFSRLLLRDADGRRLAGSLTLEWPRAAPDGAVDESVARRGRMRGELVADVLRPSVLLAMVLGEPSDGRRLRRQLAGGWGLDVRLRADALLLPWPEAKLPDARVTLRRDGAEDALQATLSAGDGQRQVRGEVRWRRQEQGLETEGTLHVVLPLRPHLRVAQAARDGVRGVDGVAEMTLALQGRALTLQGLAAGLKGVGRLKLKQARVLGVAPRRLVEAVRGMTTEAALQRFDALVKTALHGGNWALPEEVATGVVLEGGLLEIATFSFAGDGVRTEVGGVLKLDEPAVDVSLRFVPTGADAPPPFALALAGAPGALTASVALDDVREWVQQQVIRRKEEEIRRLEAERARREEQLREQRLRQQEEARQQEERRREEELRRRGKALEEEATRLRQRLQEVLAKAHERMNAAQGAKQKPDAADGKDGAALTIEDLIRQAQEEERAEAAEGAAGGDAGGGRQQGAAGVPGQGGKVDGGNRPGAGAERGSGRMSGAGRSMDAAALPAEAMAQPQAFDDAPPLPRMRPAQPRQRDRPRGRAAASASGQARKVQARQGKGRAQRRVRSAQAGKTRQGARRGAGQARGRAAGDDARATPAGRRGAASRRRDGERGKATNGRQRAENGQRRAVGGQRQGGRVNGVRDARRRAAARREVAKRRETARREVVRPRVEPPLTNWNGLAPAR